MQPSKPTYLYHITDHKNLKAISTKGLLSKTAMALQSNDYINIAYESVQGRRANIEISCGKKGELHDYVPFYFAPRSPMLYCIEKQLIEGYSGAQRDIIYLVTTVETIEKMKLSYVFTDGHAIMNFTQFFDDLKYMDKIDWPLMESKYWFATLEDPDRKRRRQAEFLVYQVVPWAAFSYIAVYDEKMKQTVTQLLENCPYKPKSMINRPCYY